MNETKEIAARRFKVLALCDDESTCFFCGREDLQRVVAFEDLDNGETVFAGTTCAQTVKLIVLDEETGEERPMKAREILTRAERANREAKLAAELEAFTWRCVELHDAAALATEERYPHSARLHPLARGMFSPCYSVNGGADRSFACKIERAFAGVITKVLGVTFDGAFSWYGAPQAKSLAKREAVISEATAELEAARLEWAAGVARFRAW